MRGSRAHFQSGLVLVFVSLSFAYYYLLFLPFVSAMVSNVLVSCLVCWFFVSPVFCVLLFKLPVYFHQQRFDSALNFQLFKRSKNSHHSLYSSWIHCTKRPLFQSNLKVNYVLFHNQRCTFRGMAMKHRGREKEM